MILVVLVIMIAQTFSLVIHTYSSVNVLKKQMGIGLTGKASGVVNFCINSRPSINASNCNMNATQDVNYDCWVGVDDSDIANLTFYSYFQEFHRSFNNTNDSFFNITSDGHISFTPTNNDVGNFTIIIRANDGVGCSNSEDADYWSFQVQNVNDAPYLFKDIANQNLIPGEVLHAFYLDNHFTDPDMDDLNYSVVTTTSAFTITINQETSGVVISTVTCDISGFAMFIATDPYNETNTSNLVTIRCVTPETSTASESGSGTGGGGGGGLSDICIPEYECFDYYKCRKNNTKVQKCVDKNGCEEDVYLTVPCIYEEELLCNESWECTAWANCLPNGTQYRNCTDVNDCGTTEHMPELSRSCEYLGSCDDSIQNCHDGSCEEGIDCGGPCTACKSIEVPYPFKEEKGILIYIITGIILLLLTAILLYHYFRKEINSALAKAGWVIKRRKRKQVLLSAEDKKKLLKDITELMSKFERLELADLLSKYSNLLRHYLTKACGVVENPALSPDFDMNELKLVLSKKKSRVVEVLRRIFIASFEKYIKVESNKDLITRKNLLLMLEELRNLVLQTSKVENEDIAREEKEIPVQEKADNLDKAVTHIINAYIALEFLELEVAKKKYLELLAEYEKLGMKDQEAVYNDIIRLYDNISYVNSWLQKPKE